MRVLATELPAAEAATAAASGGKGGSTAVQEQYDAARDLQEALLEAAPVSRSCEPALAAALKLARGQTTEAEGFDRPSPSISERGRRIQANARSRLSAVRSQCHVGSPRAERRVPGLIAPLSGEAFFGHVVAAAPPAATFADLYVGDRLWARRVVEAKRVTFELSATPGSYTLTVRFRNGDRQVGVARSRRVWLLPSTAQRGSAAGVTDTALDGRLAREGRNFSGFSAIWTHDLTTGRTAGWSENVLYPAASTVKLGVLLVGLAQYSRPLGSRIGYDLAQMIRWSSNLATNRLLVKLGGSASGGAAQAEAALRRVGASSSTFTGSYIPGTRPVVGASGTTAGGPPLVSQRTTTARDLGRVLWALHAAAIGNQAALSSTRLTTHQARVGLGWLLSSQSTGENIGLFRPVVRYPMAQKHGWISSARHSAAIIYTPSGPKIAVVLTYREGITRAAASEFAHRILRTAGLSG